MLDALTFIPAVTCVAPTITNGQTNQSVNGSFPFNATVSFLCNYGYKLDGSDSSTCDIYGEWSPQPARCTQGNKMYRFHIYKMLKFFSL